MDFRDIHRPRDADSGAPSPPFKLEKGKLFYRKSTERKVLFVFTLLMAAWMAADRLKVFFD